MIMLMDSAIMILDRDGRATPFDSEELQTRIIKACLAAGGSDTWIAQDISLSVEFAILSQSGGAPARVGEAEFDALVVKVLDETGYPEVAERFRSSLPKDDSLIRLSDTAFLADFLARRAGLEGARLDSALAATLAAFAKLGIERVSPQLALEMARHYKDVLPPESHPFKAPRLKAFSRRGVALFLAEAAELLELSALPRFTAKHVESGALSARPLSGLFPSLGIGLDFARFAEAEGLAKPSSELALLPRFGALAESVDAVARRADSLCAAAGRSDCVPLPLWIEAPGLAGFCRDWLSYAPEGLSDASNEIIASFGAMLERTPFKWKLN
jgi:hypothetical protein